MMFTKEELEFLYKLLDQISVSGIPQKQLILSIMAKIEELAKEA
jgi:hypothetical protein